MDEIMKIIVDMQMDEDINEFIESNSNEQGIDTSKLYMGQCVYIPKILPIMKADTEAEIKANSEFNAQHSFRILINSSVKTPHNRFLIDIINKQSLGEAHGWTGIACVPNTGFCVKMLEILSTKTNKLRMSLEEISIFIEEYNLSRKEEYQRHK